MTDAANWLISVGFCLILVGVALRIVGMMRASDAGFSATPDINRRQAESLMSLHKRYFPGSVLPKLSVTLMVVGAASLLSGLGIHLWR